MDFTIEIECNKLIACKFLELVSEGNVEKICEMIASDWNMHIGLSTFKIPSEHEGMRRLFETFGQIKQQWIIEDVLAEGDKVAVRATNNGMQENFLGIPSYGRPQTFTATFIHRIINGKIQQTWRNADDLGCVLQLGASIMPAVVESPHK